MSQNFPLISKLRSNKNCQASKLVETRKRRNQCVDHVIMIMSINIKFPSMIALDIFNIVLIEIIYSNGRN
ncbi:hypothetical protein BpHYR1_012058 [Brachionus plicatilis]|uniref:Uncharacterized protein n=1 Tax=Brachionus plicatilis TaxID=10195 RepID=A0A3M7SVZ4_BRAPC|nr:hypothetical protein BpHYR1_012058 [Brachionus plicatilis]